MRVSGSAFLSVSTRFGGEDSNNLSKSVSDARLKTSHELKITGLTPISLLYYQVGFNDSFMANTVCWTPLDKINSGVPAGEKLVLRLKTVGIIYTDKNFGPGITQMTQEEIRQIEEYYRNAALWVWYNSGFSVWIDFIAMPLYTGDFIKNDQMWENRDTRGDTVLRSLGFNEKDDFDWIFEIVA